MKQHLPFNLDFRDRFFFFLTNLKIIKALAEYFRLILTHNVQAFIVLEEIKEKKCSMIFF